MKQRLASIGVTVLALLAGVVVVVVTCVAGGLYFLWRVLPEVPAPGGGVGESSLMGFDGPAWAQADYQARRADQQPRHVAAAWRAVAAAEFDRVGAARERFPAAALLCRVSMERGAWDQTITVAGPNGSAEDLFQRSTPPDIAARLELGGAPVRYALGPMDQHEATVAFPLTALPTGATITLRAFDVDTSVGNDAAGESTVQYDGHLPIRFTGRRFTAECRGVAPERARALAEPAVRALDAFVSRFDLPHYDSVAELGIAEGRSAKAHQDVIALADWLGWSHPEVRRLDALAEAVPRELPRQIAATLGALPLTREARLQETVGLRLLAWRCGAAAQGRCGVTGDQGCVAELELGRDPGESPLIMREWAHLFGPEGRLQAVGFQPLPGRRQHCIAFDASAAPTLREGRAPAVLLLPNASAPIRVQ